MLRSAPTEWVYDFVYHYRFNTGIIQTYLRQKWGEYDFEVKVSLAPPTTFAPSLIKMGCPAGRGLLSIRRPEETHPGLLPQRRSFHAWYVRRPSRLTRAVQSEKDELDARRLRKTP